MGESALITFHSSRVPSRGRKIGGLGKVSPLVKAAKDVRENVADRLTDSRVR